MNYKPTNEQCKHHSALEDEDERRQIEERRKEESRGFTCISTVGWICRRERMRRKDDTCPWW